MSLPTHDEPWLRDELDALLAGEPEMRATVQDDVRRGERARAVRRRRATVTLTVAALVVAVGVPVGLTLRASGGSTNPTDQGDSPLGHVWSPEEGYVTPTALASRISALVPAPIAVTPAGSGFGPYASCPSGPSAQSGCSMPSYDATFSLRQGSATATLDVRQSVQAIPDISRSLCSLAAAGALCVESRAWTKAGSSWVAGMRTATSTSTCAETVVVRRGRTAVTATESLPRAACGAGADGASLVAAAPLTKDQLTALALATPLAAFLNEYIDVAIYGPELTSSPAPSSSVPVTALWSPADGYVGQAQFEGRAREAVPQGVTSELVAPSRVRDVPCGFARLCGGGGYGGAYQPDPNAPKPVFAAFNVSRGGQTGLLVLGEDTTSGNQTAALRTCLGYAGCTQLRPWTREGDTWTAVFENVSSTTGLVDRTAYVVRGSSAFGVSAQTQVLRADDVLQTLSGATPVLTADELLAMAKTLPLGDYDGELIRHGAGVQHVAGPASYDSVRACTSDDLALTLVPATDAGPATADIAKPLLVRATPRRDATCLLTGTPGLSFSGGASDRLTVAQRPGGVPVLVGPRAYASAPVARGSCPSGVGGTGPVTAQVFAPDGGQAGTTDVEHYPYLRVALAPCAAGDAAADTITVGPFSVADGASWPGPL